MPKKLRTHGISPRWCALLLTVSGCASALDGGEEAELLSQETTAEETVEDDALLDGGASADTEEDAAIDAGPPPPPPNQITLTGVDEAPLARITASGAGCPLDSWSIQRSEDGRTYSVTFDELDLSLDDARLFTSKNCLLTILPLSGSGMQFTARKVAYTGRTKVEQGTVAAVEVRHYAQGSRPSAAPAYRSHEGPYEGELAVSREIDGSDERWTSCTRESGVNIDTLVRLSNGVPRTGGTLSSDAVDGRATLIVELAARACPPPRGQNTTR